MHVIEIDVLEEELGTYLIAKITPDIANQHGLDYAFYLFKDNVRIETQWYSESNSCKFDISNQIGLFSVKGFIRYQENLNTVSIFSNKVRHNLGPYHIKQWGKKVRSINLNNFSEEFVFENCIYQFDCNGQNVDFLIDGAERYKSHDDILVCFNAAVSPRNNQSAPFFSGLSIARNLDMPIIAISDPSLTLSFNLTLSWYAGSNKTNELTKYLAKILDRISIIMNSKLVLFGGSGGGFAALSVIPYMKERAYGVVWNPQTSISRYDRLAVQMYLSICFNKNISYHNFYDELESTGVVHDLIRLYKNLELNGSQILYLQNLGDKSHVENHANPFMFEIKAKESKSGVFHSPKGVTFWLNNWGDGHIVPNTDVILQALREMSTLKDSLEVALKL